MMAKFMKIIYATACLAVIFLIHNVQRSSNITTTTTPISKTSDRQISSSFSSDSKYRSHAVVHMGIHKTGTTSIQELSKLFAKELQQDGYEMPWVVWNTKKVTANNSKKRVIHKPENQKEFATCFLPHSTSVGRVKFPCLSDLLTSGLEIAERNNHILITAEIFDEIDSNGLKDLSDYLSNWDEVTIVIYYRRYYEWIASFFNQKMKGRKLHDDVTMWDYSILDYVTLLTASTTTTDTNVTMSNGDEIVNVPPPGELSQWDIHQMYTPNLVERVKEHFENVVVMNMHNKSADYDNSQSFYCDAMPNAHHTCKAVTHAKHLQSMSSSNLLHTNSRTDLIYTDLVYGAKQKGLLQIPNNKQLKRVTNEVQKHQEQTLNRTKDDFQMQCLPSNIQKKIFKKTLQYEQMIFPHTTNDSLTNQNDLQLDFDMATKSTLLCKIDVDATLEEDVWQSYFKNVLLKVRNNNNL